MEIREIKRPWIKGTQVRYNPDSYYQSKSWKDNRRSFREGYTEVNGIQLSNKYCIDCFKESRSFVLGSNTDHIIPRKEGGSDDHTNLQTQCDTHHAKKSANEGNERRKNG
jgi:5-methylcytosine-specific restriction endonuclease McrA